MPNFSESITNPWSEIETPTMKGFIILLAIVAATLAEPPVPSTKYLPSNRYLPSTQYLPSASIYSGQSFNQSPRMNYASPSNVYLPTSYARANTYEENYNSQPANYNFQYDVQDGEHGNDYTHVESRQDDNTQGKYSVLLPDGRKQTVEYTADGNGFNPKITYEQTNNGYERKFGGYNSGYAYNNGNNGYNGNSYSNGIGYSNVNGYSNGNYYNNGNGYNNGNSDTNENGHNINSYSNGDIQANGGYHY